jgi:hypothetical protein
MNKNILVFSSREICYLSGNFFADQLADAFEQLGCDVTLCEFTMTDDFDEKLMPLLDKTYDAAIDFNSMIPQMVLEDGTSYLDRLQGPFFNYVLDHPLFHYNVLNSNVNNLNALVLDEVQCDYVSRYYHKVKNVFALPLGATEAVYDGPKNDEVRVFMPGTYDSPDGVYKIIEESPEPLRNIMETLAKQRINEPLTPMEELFLKLIKERELKVTDDQFALYMNSMYAVDAYVRDYFRKKAIDELLSAGIPVTVMGSGWENYSHANESLLKRMKEVPFALSFERIAKEHIILNVSPIFNRGMHDRVPAGMANNTVVMTDVNPYLERHFTDGKDICFYSLTGDDLCEKATGLIDNPHLREDIAANAHELFKKEYTWIRRAEKILDIAGNLK